MLGVLRNINSLIDCRFTVHSYFDQTLQKYSVDYHTQPTVELLYVIDGRANYTFLDKNQRTVAEHLKNGDLILIDAECPHRLSIEKGCHALFLELRNMPTDSDSVPTVDSYAVICNCDSLIKAFGGNDYILLNDFLYIKQSILRLHALLNSDKLEYVDHYFTQTIISELLLSINECYKKTYLNNSYISRVVEFIIRNYQENVTARCIAEAMHLNETYIQKLFKKEMGVTLLEYTTQYRISQSISLMRNTNMKITDIAAEVGFNNRQTFFNAFKEFTGYTPKLFKKFLASPTSSFTAKWS
jgi:AraC-like DNA-binding protein/mannose-6-phosphate isomerase-like protein (cupin superfamily)